MNLINTKNEKELPIKPIPPIQGCIAGGFFIIHKDNISWWSETYDSMLKKYFENNGLEFKPYYWRNGSNYKKQHKLDRGIELAKKVLQCK